MDDDLTVTSAAAAYATRLLTSLGLDVELPPEPGSSALIEREWQAISGPGPASRKPVTAAQGCLMAIRALAPTDDLPGSEVLTRRATLEGLSYGGQSSCRGTTRLLAAADGLVAITLARPSDRGLVPALVEASPTDDPWSQVASWLSQHPRLQAAERLELLGLPYGVPGEMCADLPWVLSPRGERATRDAPRVVTLAALWAGPLCAQVLRKLGCTVTKVEDPRRPDGMRRGSPALFDELHEGVDVVALPIDSAEVADLVAGADIVVEGSRPRALRQLGLIAEEHPGTWVSITGHGRASNRVAFGDDAAVSGGLVHDGCFIGDAVSDPLTGLHAALAAWACVRTGRAGLIDVSLARTAAAAAGLA